MQGCRREEGVRPTDLRLQINQGIGPGHRRLPTGLPVAFQAQHLLAETSIKALFVCGRAARRIGCDDQRPYGFPGGLDACFAGHRQSGYGVGGIPFTMREMSQEKDDRSTTTLSGLDTLAIHSGKTQQDHPS